MMTKDNSDCGNIGQAINAIMHAVEYVQKEKAGGLKYTYVGEAGLLAALRPAMVEHGVYVYPSRVEQLSLETYKTSGGTVMNRTIAVFEFTFMHAPSGTSIAVCAVGEGADVGDKGCNKAMTGALKYALRQTFGIITGDDPDMSAGDGQQRASDSANIYNAHDASDAPRQLSALANVALCDMSSVERGGVAAYVEKQCPDIKHRRHFANRWKKRFGVDALERITATASEFADIMRATSEEWSEEW